MTGDASAEVFVTPTLFASAPIGPMDLFLGAIERAMPQFINTEVRSAVNEAVGALITDPEDRTCPAASHDDASKAEPWEAVTVGELVGPLDLSTIDPLACARRP